MNNRVSRSALTLLTRDKWLADHTISQRIGHKMGHVYQKNSHNIDFIVPLAHPLAKVYLNIILK